MKGKNFEAGKEHRETTYDGKVDLLTYEQVKGYLDTEFIGRYIQYFDSIDSTNKKAKEIALGEEEGTVLISEEQLEGRGRLGRRWISPKGKGIWMSVILKPETSISDISKITLLAAAAICKALEIMGIGSEIKWPNDILIAGKKVCGILTEMNCELNKINYVVMGMGINANLDINHIPEDLRHKATSIKIEKGRKIDRKVLVANILNEFEKLYIPFKYKGNGERAIEICRKNSAMINKEVRIIKGDRVEIGRVLDINQDGELLVEFKNGRKENIFSGEISIRGLNGYF